MSDKTHLATISSIGGDRIWIGTAGAVALSKAHAIGCLLRAKGPGGRPRSKGGYLQLIDRERGCIGVSEEPRPGAEYVSPLAWCAGDTIHFNPEEM